MNLVQVSNLPYSGTNYYQKIPNNHQHTGTRKGKGTGIAHNLPSGRRLALTSNANEEGSIVVGTPALLATKLNVPPARAQLVVRPRLFERLESAYRAN